MKRRAYIYPVTGRLKTGVNNPYLDDFMDSLSSQIDFVNREHPSQSGLFNILKFAGKLDYIFLNWIEDLPDKKLGLLQSFLLLFCFRYFRLRKTKIVWTLHNRLTHHKKNEKLKKYLIHALAKHSNLVLTHAKAGLDYARELNCKGKVLFLPHPVKDFTVEKIGEKKNDLLVWGTIVPYKGVDSFLNYLYEHSLEHKYNILITGKILSESYKEEILRYQNDHIKIIDCFLDFEEIKKHIASSKMVLFTYQSDSVLSSGALMDSLACKAHIVGPSKGAFKEMAEEGIVEVFSSYDELIELLNERLSVAENEMDKRDVLDFIRENSWSKFGENFNDWLLKNE